MVTLVNRAMRNHVLFDLHIPFCRRYGDFMRPNEEDLDPYLSTSMGALNVDTRDDNLISGLRLETEKSQAVSLSWTQTFTIDASLYSVQIHVKHALNGDRLMKMT